MQIILPDDLEKKLDAHEVLLDLAVGMYAARRITLGRGAEIAGVAQMDFQRELAQRRVPLHYDLDDLQSDIQAVRELSGPMIVVSDTSPVSALIQIGEVHLLEALFVEVILPPAVERELRVSHPSLPDFLQVRPVLNHQRVRELTEVLDAGEAEAIVLAGELHADPPLIDEKAGRKVAQQEGLAIIGVLGVLLLARKRNLIARVRDQLERLDATGFYLDDAVKTATLRAAGEE